MKTISLKLLQKQIDAISLAVKSRVLTFEGEIRSGKTVTAIECFYYAVFYSPDDLHALCAKDYDAIRDNLLHSNGLGLLDLFPNVELKKEQIGGYFLQLTGADGRIKKILLVGYSTTKQWEKILGKTIGIIYADEINIADETFVDESWARQTSAEKPLTIYTLNGDNPSHFIYQKYINYCKPIGDVPQEILDEMNQFPNRPRWYYFHWKMTDNPVMTKEKIEAARSIYMPGSYYYQIKILGLRGLPEGTIFAQYLDASFTTKTDVFVYRGQSVTEDEAEYNLASGKYIKYCFGLDLGNNDIKRGTIITFSGITYGFKNFDVIDSYQCRQTESNALVEEIVHKLVFWHSQIPNLNAVDSVRIDGYGAVQVLVPTIRKQLQYNGVRTLTDLALKFGEQAGRKARMDLLSLLITQHRLRFSQRSGAQETFNQLKKLRYADDGLPLDVNQLEMDYYDSLGYTLTPFTKLLTNVLR